MDINGRLENEPQKMRANRRVLETNCPICKAGFQMAEEVYKCPSCLGYHHLACWDSSGRCSHPDQVLASSAAGIDLAEPAPVPFGGQAAPTTPLDSGPTTPEPTPANSAASLAPDERHCPICKEVIKREALKCRFCGKVFDPRMIQPRDAPDTKLPSLHWALVLLLSFLTCGFFIPLWGIRHGTWAKKVDSSSNATLFYALYLGSLVVFSILSEVQGMEGLSTLMRLAGVVLLQSGNFSIKGTIEDHYNTQLSGVMTFFFGPVYHQYHFGSLGERESELTALNL